MTNISITKTKRAISWIAMGTDLIDCLKTKGNQRLSRYDAFIWIIERIQKGDCLLQPSGALKSSQSFRVASLERLAQEWNWSTPTVREFLQELIHLSAIKLKREGNTLVFFVGDKSCANLIL